MVSRREVEFPLPLERRDYADAPGVDAHAAWAAGAWPTVAAAFDSQPLEPFYSHAVSVGLGGMTLQYATGSGRILKRDLARIDIDGLTMLVVGVQFDAPMTVERRPGPVMVPAGALLLVDLTQPIRVAISASRSVQLAIPRALAETHLGPVRRLHGRVVAPAAARLAVEHLQSLREAIPELAADQAGRLADILLTLLAVAVSSEDGSVKATGETAVAPAATREEIEAALVRPSTTLGGLSRTLGVSRSTLSRMFTAEGGVEAHRRDLRLTHVRDALLDPENDERIGALAERWGFSDASHLTRAFRRRYGTTPSAMRLAAARG